MSLINSLIIDIFLIYIYIDKYMLLCILGRYRYQFTEVGTFFVWSGYVDEWSIKSYTGTVNVVEAQSSIAEVSVNVMGTEASHPDPGNLQGIATFLMLNF